MNAVVSDRKKPIMHKPGGGVHVYDENGDEILTYTAGADWHEKESKTEKEAQGGFDERG